MGSIQMLQQAIADMTIWRKGEQRAPHKPLLLLYVLAGYQQGHGRLFDYASEVRDNLRSLLERFGPQRAQYRPDMPFWRLQGDGFWQLQNAERCSTFGSSRQPPAGELVEFNVAGGFDKQHYDQLIKSKKLINSLARQILEAHFTESIQEELADELGFELQLLRKQRDPLFRQQVLRAYNYECAICGYNMRHDNTSVALEAAHIKWKQYGGPCEIPNGLALCAIHHKAFDKGSIGLDESMRVQVSEAVNGSGIVGRLFWDFQGKIISLPQVKAYYPQDEFVDWHRREVFRR
ncbi:MULTISPECIES: phosphorothioated DNA-binding restriction endonuclease [Citrobacter]|uniref:phosphorothioated DNA-binding restriction endonuclease n=1 Tax=Citrobacter TaxID=544 RepID=UPI0005C9A591|nr:MULTISPECIES: HNH endonuclease [Citrobacter]KKF71591.1 restriction endonuclease [Vibrio parahaemolyticus]EKW5057694.1 HNH endonuclease [Citrobacter amalonaticus]EKX8496192.1 HNH endonuclease [Citrobacter amalonaticus]ELO0858041.1 HNH endonuclease [Citrobacter amalonaticus]ELT8116398.1 HNH endonuclease [Citrobacter amalonaticus]